MKNSYLIGIGFVAGIGIGFAIGFFTHQSSLQDKNGQGQNQTSSQDNLGFYVYGLVKEISPSELILDQTFNRTNAGDNPAVRISLKDGASLLTCEFLAEGPTVSICGPVNLEDIKAGTYTCAQSRELNGEVIGGKIFFNSTCGWISPFPNTG